MPERIDRIAAVAERYVNSGSFSSVEWSVDVDGKSISTGKAGKADQETGADVADGALYRIYSMTKPVVSVLALQLIEQGRLRFTDMLPQFDGRFANMLVLTADGQVQAACRPITLEDLLTHRSGFTYEFMPGHIGQYYREAQVSYNDDSLDEMMGRISKMPLGFHPGAGFGYGVSTDVLAHVIERATGKGVDELLAENIFKPLGMEDTAYCVPEEKQSRLVKMYGREGFLTPPALTLPPKQELVPVDVNPYYPVNKKTFRRGGIGLYSTLADYRKFANMLIDGKSADGQVLLSRKMVEMISENRIPERLQPVWPGIMEGYGWGLLGRVRLNHGQTTSLSGIGEFGWAGGASTFFWVDPNERMTGIILTQYLGSWLPLPDDLRTAAYQALA
ncbi:MAG: serine hydrolase domain-containing protein [Hyphomonas sp.]